MDGTGAGMVIDSMTLADWERVRAIYLEGIAGGNATFETEAPSWEKWDAGHLAAPRLVARAQAGVLGWAALSKVSGRCVYAGVADESIYVDAAARGQGVGKALLTRLCDEADRAGLWTLQAGIFPENVASVRLHEACGFRVVGRRERIGKHGTVWRDVLFLERRSRVAGTD
ncbi:MAG: N-acetyltransferase family protein [Rhodospirillales bacterium]